VKVPEGVPPSRFAPGKDDFGMPSQRTIWERQFVVARKSQTMSVSRRERQGPRRSNHGHPNVRLEDRIDPFWEIDWEAQFGGGPWRRVSVQRHQLTTDARGNATVKTVDAYAPIAMTPNESYGENAMRIMALLFQFGGMSTSQLCSFMDSSLKGLSYALNRLYGLGLVERMTPSWVRPTTASARLYHGSGDVWRVNLRSDTVTTWLEGLSSIEYALMTGGRDGGDLLHNGTFMHEHTMRHNLAVTELCLRALETAPGIAGVWGEPFVQGSRFLSEAVRNSVDVRYVRGDAAVVTKDGAVIVIELTGTRDTRSEHGATIAERAAAWAAISHLSDVPLSLAIVSIGGYSASRRIAKHLRENTERELGRYFANVADKQHALSTVHMSSIQSWWPSPGATSRKFLTLESFSPFTNEYRELAPADAQWDTTEPAVVNTVAALHSPRWGLNPVVPISQQDGGDQ
jgi:hypothetical protein